MASPEVTPVALSDTEDRRSSSAPGRSGLRQALVWGIGAFAILRVVASLAAWVSLSRLSQGTTVGVPGYVAPHLHGVGGVLAGAWLRADALWYLRIATVGYGGPNGNGSYAFLPLFPELVRLVTPLTGGQGLYAALAVANVSCLLGFVWLYQAVESLGGTSTARAAVIGLAVFPTSFFLVAPYGEPVFLAAGAGALLAAARGRPGLAALAGVLAALARPFGVLIVVLLAPFLLMEGRIMRPRWWLTVLAPVAGVLVWLAWAGHRLRDPLGALRIQGAWQRTLLFPWDTLMRGLQTWLHWRGTTYGPYMLLDLLAAAFGLILTAAAVVVLRRRGAGYWMVAAYAAYGLLVLTIPMSSPFLPRPLMSMPRFVLALFPLFLGYGAIRPPWRLPLAVMSGAGLAWVTALYVAARPIF